MEAKVTSTRKLEVYPSKHNKEIETAETIFIEDILKLKNEGDSILLTRRNASGLSCLAYLESRPVEKLVIPQGEPSLSELLEENKRLKDSIEKYKQMVTQILFIMKNQSERNGETQTV